MSSLETAVPEPRSAGTFWWLIAVQALGVLGLVPWLFATVLSVWGVAWEPVSGWVWPTLLAIWTYPLWLIVFSALAWIAYRKRRNRRAVLLSLGAFIPVVVLEVYAALTNPPAS
jgi:hypothetical protein